ncbi:MAG: protein kinase domain-containing protein [Promethearchaeia archaeon]
MACDWHTGIAHRDLKPENLMYKSHDPNSPDYDTVKVTDFGLANWNFSQKGTMRTACGTPNYIAPEVILVDEGVQRTTYGTAVDIWSLGVAVYVMLCGFAPRTRTLRRSSR